MQNGTAVLVVGTVGSFLKAPTSRKGWGHKAPSTLLIDVRVEGDDSNPENQSTPQTVVETFEMKIWEYVPVDVERELTPGSLVCARGILSGKTTRGLMTLEKPQLAMHVDQNAQCEVVPTYPKKHDVAPDRWPEIQRAAVECLTKVLPADPMLISLGLESSVLPELNLMSHVDAMKHIHRPDSVERVCDARERLAFEELVLLQTSLLIERERAQNSGGEGVAVVSTALCDALRNVLDFSLTRGQENALEEIFHDMAGTKPMLRMLQGAGLFQSPRSACLIAHTRPASWTITTRRDYFQSLILWSTVYPFQSLIPIPDIPMADRLTLSALLSRRRRVRENNRRRACDSRRRGSRPPRRVHGPDGGARAAARQDADQDAVAPK
jgi:hypothetical protein